MDPRQTLKSGQVFLWKESGGSWYGVDGQRVLRADHAGVSGSSDGHYPDFFRMDDDIGAIRASLGRDALLRQTMKRYPDLRITRQDFFQCLISFIVSANSNIPRIRRNLQEICSRFGGAASLDGVSFDLFPTPRALAAADLQEILACGTGYRSIYIREAAAMVSSGALDPDEIMRMPYRQARASMTGAPGVGNKVADCILLFSLGFLEALPLDRWVVRVLSERYGLGTGKAPHTDRQYQMLHEQAVERLGPYAGYAQQYLFKMARDTASKPLKW